MLLGKVKVVGLGVEDVAQLEVGAGADHGGRGEVEDGGEASDTFLDVVRLEIGVGEAEERRVPRVLACHDPAFTRHLVSRPAQAHSTFRIISTTCDG